MTADRTGTVSLALLGLSCELHVLKHERYTIWQSIVLLIWMLGKRKTYRAIAYYGQLPYGLLGN
jgi:hypothetical protein